MTKKFEHFQQVLVRDHDECVWVCAFFSHYSNKDEDTFGGYVCTGGHNWRYCIPYKGNENLVGTYKSPEEKEKFKFGDKVMVKDDDTEWIKATFMNYYSKRSNDDYCYEVCTTYGIASFKYCRKGWDEDA